MCVNIQEYLQCYLVFFITIKSNAELMKWPTYVCTYDCMYVCECARVYACMRARVSMYVCTYVCTCGHQPGFFLILSHHSHQQKAGGDGC